MKIYFKSFFILFLYSNISIAATCKDVFKKSIKEPVKGIFQIDIKEKPLKISKVFFHQTFATLKNISKDELAKKAENYTPEQNYVLGKSAFIKGIKLMQDIEASKGISSIKLDMRFFNKGYTGKAFILLKQADKQGNHQALDWVRFKLGEIIEIQRRDEPFQDLYFKDLDEDELVQLAEFNTIEQNYVLGKLFLNKDIKDIQDMKLNRSFFKEGKAEKASIFFKQAAEKGHADSMLMLVQIYAFGSETMKPNFEETKKWLNRGKKIPLWQHKLFDAYGAFWFAERNLQQTLSQDKVNPLEVTTTFIPQTIVTLTGLKLVNKKLLEKIKFYISEQTGVLSWSFFLANKDQAFTFLKKAAKKNNPYAMYWLADIYSAGTETMKPNLKESENWLAEFNKNSPENLEDFGIELYLVKMVDKKEQHSEIVSKAIFEQTFPTLKDLDKKQLLEKIKDYISKKGSKRNQIWIENVMTAVRSAQDL